MATFDYIGRYEYFLTFVTDGRRPVFVDAEVAGMVLKQFRRAAREKRFEITAYCCMADHVHLLMTGLTEASDCRAFIKLAKQYSGYYFARRGDRRLWQRYGFEHALRSGFERSMVIEYILENPTRAGFAEHPAEYPLLGSDRYTIDELIEQAGGLDDPSA